MGVAEDAYFLSHKRSIFHRFSSEQYPAQKDTQLSVQPTTWLTWFQMDLELVAVSEITNRPPSLLPFPPGYKAGLHFPVSFKVSHGYVAGSWPTDCGRK